MKRQLEEHLGAELEPLSRFLPQLGQVIQLPEQDSDVSSASDEARIVRGLRKFLALETSRHSRLLLAVDDLQWADPSTVKLVADLLKAGLPAGVLLVLSFRQEGAMGASKVDPLAQGQWPSRQFSAVIDLSPLDVHHISTYLHEILHPARGDLAHLAEICAQKTGGIPFYLREFVRSIFSDGALHWNADTERWAWNAKAIASRDVTSNVVGLIVSRLAKLPVRTYRMLQVAAALGSRFSQRDLARLYGPSESGLVAALDAAVQQELLVAGEPREFDDLGDSRQVEPVHGEQSGVAEYRFMHDRIQEAVYASASPSRQAVIHRRIGRRLRTQRDARPATKLLGHPIDHLNLAESILLAPDQRSEFAHVNRMVARRAKNSAAYGVSAGYLRAGLAFLDTTSHTRLAAKILTDLAEVEYLGGNNTLALTHIDEALRRDPQIAHDDTLCGLRITVYSSDAGYYEDALLVGKAVLRGLGLELPIGEAAKKSPSAIAEVVQLIEARGAASLSSGRPMTDPKLGAVMRTLMQLLPAAHYLEPELNDWIVTQMAALSIRHGTSPETAKACVNFGSLLTSRAMYRLGYEIGEMGWELSRSLRDPMLRGRTQYTFLSSVNLWRRPIQTATAAREEALASCAAAFDSLYTGHILAFDGVLNGVFAGENLVSFDTKVSEYQDRLSASSSATLNVLSAARLAIVGLQGSPNHADEAALLQRCLGGQGHAPSYPAANLQLLLGMIRLYLYRDDGACVVKLEQYVEIADRIPTTMPTVVGRFLAALVDVRVQLGGRDVRSERCREFCAASRAKLAA